MQHPSAKFWHQTHIFSKTYKRNNRRSINSKPHLANFHCEIKRSQGIGKTHAFHHPSLFLSLENVKGVLRHDSGKTWQRMLTTLESIGRGIYNIKTKSIDTRDHGIPQRRSRVYIIGIRRDVQVHEFTFPEALPRVSLSGFLDPSPSQPTMMDLPPEASTTAHFNVKDVLRDLTSKGHTPLSDTFVVDVDSSPRFRVVLKDCVICMTKSRAQGHWFRVKMRKLKSSLQSKFFLILDRPQTLPNRIQNDLKTTPN